MSIENVYGYLEYLALAIDQLEQSVLSRETESVQLEQRISEMGDALIQAQKEIDKADARAAMAETRAYQAEAKLQEMALIVKAAKQQKASVAGQQDLFSAGAAIPDTPSRPRTANDENALILAKKLDSTIDKVQKLISSGSARR